MFCSSTPRPLRKSSWPTATGWSARDVMYNDFVIVGPPSDPAGIKGLADASEAFTKISSIESLFFSRGDNSGTNAKELKIWKAAGIEPAGDWYQATGQGMGDTLKITSEKLGYTLRRSGDLSVAQGGSRPGNPGRRRRSSLQPVWRDSGEGCQERAGCDGLHDLDYVGRSTGTHRVVRCRQVRPSTLHA